MLMAVAIDLELLVSRRAPWRKPFPTFGEVKIGAWIEIAWYECVYRASMNYVSGAVSWVVHVGRRLVESIRGYTALN